MLGNPLRLCQISAILVHHPVLGPLHVVELAGLDSPEEDEPPGEAEGEHQNYEGDDGPKHMN
jgi:hypothetical protein